MRLNSVLAAYCRIVPVTVTSSNCRIEILFNNISVCQLNLIQVCEEFPVDFVVSAMLLKYR